MIFRLTHKIAKKIHVPMSPDIPLDDNPLADWCTRLFTAQRAQYIIVTNTRFLYSIVMYGRGITDDDYLLRYSIRGIANVMTDDGFESLFDKYIAPRTGRIVFSRISDRRVIGSINELVAEARFQIVERELSPYEISSDLNDRPMSLLDMHSPKEALAALAEA